MGQIFCTVFPFSHQVLLYTSWFLHGIFPKHIPDLFYKRGPRSWGIRTAWLILLDTDGRARATSLDDWAGTKLVVLVKTEGNFGT